MDEHEMGFCLQCQVWRDPCRLDWREVRADNLAVWILVRKITARPVSDDGTRLTCNTHIAQDPVPVATSSTFCENR